MIPFDSYFVDELASAEAEQGVLGGLMMNNALWDVVADQLKPSDFLIEDHQQVFSSLMQQLSAGKAADVITVHDQMGGAASLGYLNKLAQYAPSFSSMRRYVDIVYGRAKSRELMAVSTEIADLARDNSLAIEERVDTASGLLTKLLADAPRDEWQGMESAMQEFDADIHRRADGGDQDVIPTGLRDLDAKLDGGLRPGELVIIGARPSMGKTALALTIAMNVVAAGRPCGFLSMEMTKRELQQRLVSMRSRVHLSKIKNSVHLGTSEWNDINEARDAVTQMALFITDQGGMNISQVRRRARSLKRSKGLNLLVVDYLGMMEGTDRRANRNTQLEEATRGLKTLAKELGIPVLLLAQLNREIEKRAEQMPMLSDLRDSGAIEQDADIVMFVHRPTHAKPGLGEEWRQYAKLVIAKYRSGSTGVLDLRYVGHNTQFLDWEGIAPSMLAATKGSL